MTKSQIAMGEKPILPLLLSMSLPVMLSMLITSLYNIVDSYWVAKLGTTALTAVSLAFPLQNIIMSVGVGMGIGISARVSINLGAGNREQASRAASVGVLLILVHCVLFILAGLFLSMPFLRLFTDDPETLSWAGAYTKIVMCLSFGQLLQMGLEKILQGVGKMVTTMFLMATGCIVNMILDPILIFGLCGLPAMGVRGAAYATVIGQVFAMLLYVVVFLVEDVGLSLRPRYAKPTGAMVKELYGVGLPSTLMLAMPSLFIGILNTFLVKLGSVYVAVLGLYFKLQTFVNLPANGVIQGMRPIIGFNFGAGKKDRVRKTIRWSMVLVFGLMLLGTIVALFFPEPVLLLFEPEPALLEAGVMALRIIAVSFVISTISVVTCGVFEGLGRGRQSLQISLLRQLLVLVPVAWILSRFLGANGIWLAFPVAELAALVFSLCRLKKLEHTDLA